MKIFRQLAREPVKTLFGVILVGLAVAVLCVCIGQSIAAANMEASLDSSYRTVALVTGKYQYSEDAEGNPVVSKTVPEDISAWIDEFLAENQDLVLGDSRTGLASAYIPSLTADNYTDYFIPPGDAESINYYLQSGTYGSPYTCAVLKVALEKIGEPETSETGISVVLTGTVERVISLQDGYSDPTGFTVTLTLEAAGQAEFDAMELTVGDRYLAFGMDYYDKDWELRAEIAEEAYGISYHKDWYDDAERKMAGFQIEAFDLKDMHYNDPESVGGIIIIDHGDGTFEYGMPDVWKAAYYTPTIVKEDGSTELKCVNLTNIDVEQRVRHVYLTVKPATLTRLDGMTQEVLNGSWTDYLNTAEVNDHAFAVLGVDDLNLTAPFASKTASIVEGRDFTQEELDSGAKVCVISAHLAELNGVSVGDTIELRYYSRDGAYQSSIAEGTGVVQPAAYFYTGWNKLAAPETYTVIGLYELDELWSDVNTSLYSITPNTVFAPKSAVSGEMEYADQGIFRSIVLKNGTMEEFEVRAIRAGKEGIFECYDQGYTEIRENLHDYSSVADQALKVGLAVYSVVILLFTMLFPLRQGKALDTMGKLGAGRVVKLCYVNLGSLGILVPGTVLGCTAGILLRQEVLDALTSSADVVLPLEMDIPSLLGIAAVQLLAAAAVVLAVSVPITFKRSLLNQGQKWHISLGPLKKLAGSAWVVAGFAMIIALVLCGLNAANEAEIENFEKTRKEIPVEISVQSLKGNRNNTEVEEWVSSVLTGQYGFGLSDYLTDIRIRSSMEITTLDGEQTERTLIGMTSVNCAPELLPATDSQITWKDGFGPEIFAGEELVCLVPEGYTEKDTVELYISYIVTKTNLSGGPYHEKLEYSAALTVAGTYASSYLADDVYVPYSMLDSAWKRLQISLNKTRMVESVGATLLDNTKLEEFRIQAANYFAEPDIGAGNTYLVGYSLAIDDSALRKAENMLSNSITINRISTFLVFVLSAGAGFFLGFLMIRSRKREIILMRTLGKSNAAIYRDFAWEQMLRVLLGTAIGGMVFWWQPLSRLGIFLLIYFVGLSAALILFLNSRLLTGVKEEE